MRLLIGEGFVDDALGGGEDARIGDRIEPMAVSPIPRGAPLGMGGE